MTSTIVERIKKLLALAKSSNEHEATLAMKKATELMMEHGINELPSEVVEGATIDKDKKWVGALGRAAAELYGVQILFYSGGNRFRFIGRPENLAAAELTVHWLIEQVEALYKIALPMGMTQSERSRFRRDFKEACSIRVYHRAYWLVKDLEEKGTSGCTALVVRGHLAQLKNEAHNHMTEKYPHLKARSQQLRLKASGGGIAGVAAAEHVQLQNRMGRQEKD